MRRYSRKGRGGDLPPNTDAKDLLERKKHLLPVGPPQPRDAYGKLIPESRSGSPDPKTPGGRRRTRRRRRSRRSKTY